MIDFSRLFKKKKEAAMQRRAEESRRNKELCERVEKSAQRIDSLIEQLKKNNG